MNDHARMEANRRLWDDRVDVHHRSDYYDVDSFRGGRSTLRSVELEELGEVDGRSLLHLQCHFGLDTMSLARMGARVTGVDFSEPAVALARTLAAELDIEARFIQSNVYELTRALHEQFDVVFTSYGTLTWLPDIPGWARVVARFLRPGGTFVLVDGHPLPSCLEEVDGRLEVQHSLYRDEPWELLTRTTYAGSEVLPVARENFQWPWTVGGMISALIDAGLRVQRLRELPIDTWRRFPSMTRSDDGWWRLPDDPLPLLVACTAVKPL